MLQQQIAAGGPPHFVGPFFSGANAALGYLLLQLTLRSEIKILMIRKAILRGYFVSPSFSISAFGCGSWPRKLRYRTAAS